MIGRGSFEVGEATVTLVPSNGLPSFSPMICYEVIFPAAVTGPGAAPAVAAQHHQRCLVRPDRADPTNILTSARLRTIEEGLPMIRAANTGVSAVIDAYGRILAVTRHGNRRASSTIAFHAARVATPYARWGDWTLLLWLHFLSRDVDRRDSRRQRPM